MTDLLYVYAVLVNTDGSINIDTNIPDTLDVVRGATLSDIADSVRKISADVERDLAVSSVVSRVTEALAPKPQATAGLVSEALAKRKLVDSAPEAPADDPE